MAKPMITLFAALCAVALAGCEEGTTTASSSVSSTTSAASEVRGNRSCVAAVDEQTGVPGATISTAPVVLEVNNILIDAADGSSWSCVTDASGRAQSLLKRG